MEDWLYRKGKNQVEESLKVPIPNNRLPASHSLSYLRYYFKLDGKILSSLDKMFITVTGNIKVGDPY